MKNSTRRIIFRRKDENRVVLERDNFRDTLFQEQYLSAMRSFIDVCRAMSPIPPSVSNIIAFCGDRGEGKSSCMQTMRVLLMNNNRFTIDETQPLTEHEQQYITTIKELEAYPIYPLEVIDPSFFDETHNILDLVISQLYQEAFIGVDTENETKERYRERYKLITCFDKVKESMSLLEKERREILDNIESLDRLAASMKLRDNVKELFYEFLEYRNKQGYGKSDKILICIDDLDLNVNGGYTMLEQIRKYLSNPNCVILIALKIEQMTKVVQNALYANSGHHKEIISNEMCRDMAEKYITKMFPNEHRIQMPKVEDIVDYELELQYDYELSTDTPPQPWKTIKEAVVSLIFQKTRYLFYNKENEVNLVIPRNLRSLRQLVAMLLKMDDFEKGSDISKENKNAFKKYFFNEWTNVLPEEQKELVYNIINYNDVSTKNHYVLTSLLRKELIGEETNIFDWFTAKARAYNVSVGDVLYAIQYLQETGHANLRDLLFFLQSYYSICLYDYYDELVGEVDNSAGIPAIYEYQKYQRDGGAIKKQTGITDKHVEIYAHDDRFRGISKLQQLVGGAYYLYDQGELLPEEIVNIKEPHTSKVHHLYVPREYRALDAGTIFKYMRAHSKENIPMAHILTQDDKELTAFLMCEFIALTTKMTQTADEYKNRNYRDRSYPYYLSSFKRGNTIIVFDILAIYSNVINLRFAYDRFNEVLWGRGTKRSFFDVALRQEGSLLNRLLSPYIKKGRESGYAEPLLSAYAMGRVASASVIRNVDVHQSLLAKVKAEKESLSKNATSGSDTAGRLIDFYQTISNTEMSLYGDADANIKELYTINYEKLLKPIIDFLIEIKKSHSDIFKFIFTSYTEKEYIHKLGVYLDDEEIHEEDDLDQEGEQSSWPSSINGIDTTYLSDLYEEISNYDWSQPLDGKFIKDHLSKVLRKRLTYPTNKRITALQHYMSADDFMRKLVLLIQQQTANQ